MRDQIRPHYLSLAGLLNKRLFRIPDYQRSYSWSSREREDLFKDIESVHNAGGNYNHFMATIVCLRRTEETLGTDLFTKLDIVDGQQRLTTLIILLNAIRRTLDNNKKKQRRLAEELAELLVNQKVKDFSSCKPTTIRIIVSLNICAKELHYGLIRLKHWQINNFSLPFRNARNSSRNGRRMML